MPTLVTICSPETLPAVNPPRRKSGAGAFGSVETTLHMRAIPDFILAQSALISLDGHACASGFYLSYEGKFVALVTAKHVLFDENQSLRGNTVEVRSYPITLDWSDPSILSLDMTALYENNAVFVHEQYDAVAIVVGGKEFPDRESGPTHKGAPLDGITVKRKANILTTPISGTKRFEDVLIGNEVYISGYPLSLGMHSDKEPLQLDFSRPLLRRGMIAGVNRDLRTIVLDCPSYYGNSGGPVVELEPSGEGGIHVNVIGIVSQFVPFVDELKSNHGYVNMSIENSGYSIATPIDTILEMLSQIKVPDDEDNSG